ncbi:12118_t:CDS:1, partial [Acaulospora morrowiae]
IKKEIKRARTFKEVSSDPPPVIFLSGDNWSQLVTEIQHTLMGQ